MSELGLVFSYHRAIFVTFKDIIIMLSYVGRPGSLVALGLAACLYTAVSCDRLVVMDAKKLFINSIYDNSLSIVITIKKFCIAFDESS